MYQAVTIVSTRVFICWFIPGTFSRRKHRLLEHPHGKTTDWKMTSLLKAPPPSPHQKALCKCLGKADESEDEEEVANSLHWGSWTGKGGQQQ
jgi:hypothetical protein